MLSKKKKTTIKYGHGTPSPFAASKQKPTPSSVASNAKFISPQKREKIMNLKSVSHQLTENKLIDTSAGRIFDTNSTELQVEINNSMWAFLSDCYSERDGDKCMVIFMSNQVNHKHVSQNLANEITNNFLGNPITADLTGKTHDKDMGHDIECLLVYNDKVNSFENYFYIL